MKPLLLLSLLAWTPGRGMAHVTAKPADCLACAKSPLRTPEATPGQTPEAGPETQTESPIEKLKPQPQPERARGQRLAPIFYAPAELEWCALPCFFRDATDTDGVCYSDGPTWEPGNRPVVWIVEAIPPAACPEP